MVLSLLVTMLANRERLVKLRPLMLHGRVRDAVIRLELTHLKIFLLNVEIIYKSKKNINK